jgi:hypothetical protein
MHTFNYSLVRYKFVHAATLEPVRRSCSSIRPSTFSYGYVDYNFTAFVNTTRLAEWLSEATQTLIVLFQFFFDLLCFLFVRLVVGAFPASSAGFQSFLVFVWRVAHSSHRVVIRGQTI